MHKRQIIREYVVALLKGKTLAGNKVYGKQVDTSDEVPRIIIMARRDSVLTQHSEEPVKYQRRLIMDINIETSGDEDVANDLADEVELLILGDYELGKNVVRCVLVDTILLPDVEGEKVFYDVTISLEIDYISTYGA
ncbi:MAG: hypothetical protein GQ468_05375 [Candidatus Scalindua sp.]|nr:hypothetical protein [Candidatus Scalindua sp.]